MEVEEHQTAMEVVVLVDLRLEEMEMILLQPVEPVVGIGIGMGDVPLLITKIKFKIFRIKENLKALLMVCHLQLATAALVGAGLRHQVEAEAVVVRRVVTVMVKNTSVVLVTLILVGVAEAATLEVELGPVILVVEGLVLPTCQC